VPPPESHHTGKLNISKLNHEHTCKPSPLLATQPNPILYKHHRARDSVVYYAIPVAPLETAPHSARHALSASRASTDGARWETLAWRPGPRGASPPSATERGPVDTPSALQSHLRALRPQTVPRGADRRRACDSDSADQY